MGGESEGAWRKVRNRTRINGDRLALIRQVRQCDGVPNRDKDRHGK
jgi:hypothetical protein